MEKNCSSTEMCTCFNKQDELDPREQTGGRLFQGSRQHTIKKNERKYEHLGKFNELQCTLCDQHKPHQMIQCE